MGFLKYLLTTVIGYIFGSINIAVLISTVFFKKDVRDLGSRNAGSTNMARVFSLGAGFATLAGDILKTVLAILVGRMLLGSENGLIVASVACLIGHCRPVFFNFKGGKGVAVSAAIGLMTDWRILLVAVITFAAVAALSRRVSLASMISVLTFPVTDVIFRGFRPWEFGMAVFVALAVIALHSENIKRLAAGTEKPFTYARPGKNVNAGK